MFTLFLAPGNPVQIERNDFRELQIKFKQHCSWLFQVADVQFRQRRVDIEYFDSQLSAVRHGTPGFHTSSLASLGFHGEREASG